MSALEIKKDIFWVGAVDWNVRDFHGYSTYKGTSYNAYLVKDEKIALFDTVKKEFAGDLFHHLRQVTDLDKIDYLIVNHVELDHAGALPEAIERIKPKKVYCSVMAQKAIASHFHREDWPLEVVKSGDVINLGKRNVHFLETRMIHWPDSMMSYIPEDKLLISSDGFGQHWATTERFDDEVENGELMRHAMKYYANILTLFSPLIQKLLAEVQNMGIAIDMIAPDHGLIWRKNPGQILAAYDSWSKQEAKAKATVIFDTMWKSTETMAKAITEGLLAEGISTRYMNLRVNHRSDVMTEVLDSKALIFGSATLNNGMLPRMADILTYVKGLRPKGKIGAAFGSFGWSGEAVKHINGHLQEMGVDLLSEGIKVKNVPTHEDLKQCVELGRLVGRAIREKLG